MPTADRVVDLLNFMAILILSVAFHEAAHAWLADRFGDDTPREHGRMTVNPFAHVHPILTIALPAVFWWMTNGRGYLFMASTPVRPWRMRRPRLHGMLTSLGGPAASLLLGIACFVAMVAFVALGGHAGRALHLFRIAVGLNVFGAAFNLLPIPPLDGSSILEFFLPRSLLPAWNWFRANSWMLFAALMMTGILGRLLAPVMNLTDDLVDLGVSLGRSLAHG